MRFRWAAAVGAALTLLDPAAHAAEKANLKVLYAGNVDSPRAKDFTSFLDKHFATVTALDLGKFREGDAKEYDVILFDWTSIYPRDKDGKIAYGKEGPGLSMPPAPRLSGDFDRPAILIGAAGGQVAGTLQLKINWL
jgi:hypothetical protein